MEELPTTRPEPMRDFFTSDAKAVRGSHSQQERLRSVRVGYYDEVKAVLSNDWLRVAALLELEGAGGADTDATALVDEGLALIRSVNHDDMEEPDPHRKDHDDKVPYLRDVFHNAGEVSVFVEKAEKEIGIIISKDSMRLDRDFAVASHIIEVENAAYG